MMWTISLDEPNWLSLLAMWIINFYAVIIVHAILKILDYTYHLLKLLFAVWPRERLSFYLMFERNALWAIMKLQLDKNTCYIFSLNCER